MTRPKILYVDDEPINLTNFKLVFQNSFNVITAESGEEAIRLFRTHVNSGLAVVVSDQRMPGMTGVELLSRLIKEDPDPTRIILTAFADFHDLSEAVNKGHIYQYLQKPWEHNTLRQVLLRAVDAYNSKKENKRLVIELANRNGELKHANLQLKEELQKTKRAEAKRREAEIRMLSQAKLASLGEMATGIAHEINQPLTFIRVMLQASKRDFLEDQLEGDEFLADIDESLEQINRITSIINHLRTFGRADETEHTKIDVKEILDKAMIPMRQKLRLAGIEVEVNIALELPFIYCVPVQIEQVFINLFSNALDALRDTENKSIAIEIFATEEHMTIVFSDNGCGMDNEVLARIFEPFFTTKDVGKGTGVGLSIVYGIVTDHGGTLACSSEKGKGTTFTIRLPLRSSS